MQFIINPLFRADKNGVIYLALAENRVATVPIIIVILLLVGIHIDLKLEFIIDEIILQVVEEFL